MPWGPEYLERVKFATAMTRGLAAAVPDAASLTHWSLTANGAMIALFVSERDSLEEILGKASYSAFLAILLLAAMFGLLALLIVYRMSLIAKMSEVLERKFEELPRDTHVRSDDLMKYYCDLFPWIYRGFIWKKYLEAREIPSVPERRFLRSLFCHGVAISLQILLICIAVFGSLLRIAVTAC